MVNVLNVHSGMVQTVSSTQTVEKVIKEIVGDSQIESDYALVFFGRKLKRDTILSQVEHLDESKTVRLVRQYHSEPKKLMSPAELLKHMEHCNLLFKQLLDNNDPAKLESLATFIRSDQYNKAILGEFTKEIKNSSQIAQDAVKDSELLISLVIKNEEFPKENPHCVLILKKAISALIEKDQEEYNAIRHRLQQPGPSNLLFQNAAPLQNATPMFTQDMLQQALMAAAANNPNMATSNVDSSSNSGPASSQNPLEVLTQHKMKYQEQLDQMRDFGFMDDDENVQALCVSDGNVELALQFIIDSRMEE